MQSPKVSRRWLAVTVLVTALLAALSVPEAQTAEWPAWERFVTRFMQQDGRVIDLTFDGKSTSEGQSYALFLALVANQRERFDTVLAWTSDNLAGGELGEKLPGWLWGKRDDGSWGLKDANAASDADLWLAYTLLEAGRLWQSPSYSAQGHKLLALVRDREVAIAGRAGPVLLPGPVGFVLDNDRYRVNPSYLPGFMFRYFAAVDPRGPWAAIWSGYLKMAPAIYAHGVAPDLFVVNSHGVVAADSERAPSGSYDAIRVYLWAGMSGSESRELLRLLTPYAALVQSLGTPPEKVNPETGAAIKADYSPVGYAGAVLPFLSALQRDELLEAQQQRLRANGVRATFGAPTNYYDDVLILFGQGWLEKRYRFSEAGQLEPAWRQ